MMSKCNVANQGQGGLSPGTPEQGDEQEADSKTAHVEIDAMCLFRLWCIHVPEFVSSVYPDFNWES